MTISRQDPSILPTEFFRAFIFGVLTKGIPSLNWTLARTFRGGAMRVHKNELLSGWRSGIFIQYMDGFQSPPEVG